MDMDVSHTTLTVEITASGVKYASIPTSIAQEIDMIDLGICVKCGHWHVDHPNDGACNCWHHHECVCDKYDPVTEHDVVNLLKRSRRLTRIELSLSTLKEKLALL